MAFRVRVVSYNVLSSHLATPYQYPSMDPHHLNPVNRLKVVLQKLEEELTTATDNNIPVIVCLQEVSYDWAGAFHTWFANRGYHLVTGLYGKKYNGYMGIALAYPTASFETMNVQIDRLSDTRKWPRPPPLDDDKESSLFTRFVQRTKSVVQSSTKTLLQWVVTAPRTLLLTNSTTTSSSTAKPPIDPWQMSENRYNVMLSATLKDRTTGQTFVIGNYHMPCAFFAPMVMTIHSDLAASHIQNIAAKYHRRKHRHHPSTTISENDENDDNDHDEDDDDDSDTIPYIIAGDWNIVPSSTTYRMLTTLNELDTTDPSYPTPKYGVPWVQSCHAMRSAYATAAAAATSDSNSNNNKEPDFTNYACTRDENDPNGTFIDTLDYIFISDQWNVRHVKPLPHRNDVKGPFPNLDEQEPSDHILLAAELELKGRDSDNNNHDNNNNQNDGNDDGNNE